MKNYCAVLVTENEIDDIAGTFPSQESADEWIDKQSENWFVFEMTSPGPVGKKAMANAIIQEHKVKWKADLEKEIFSAEINGKPILIKPSKKHEGEFNLYIDGDIVKRDEDPITLKKFAESQSEGKPEKAKQNGNKGDGVIATIFKIVKQHGSKEDPITKAEILEHLLEELPGRDPDKSRGTINHFPKWNGWEDYTERVRKTVVDGRKVGYWME